MNDQKRRFRPTVRPFPRSRCQLPASYIKCKKRHKTGSQNRLPFTGVRSADHPDQGCHGRPLSQWELE